VTVHDHHHHPHDHAGHAHGARGRALTIALAANATFLVVEVVAGLATRSLSLLADAAHMASDVAALSIALVAQRLLARPATGRHSYGLQRAEVLGAQANGIVLLAAAGWIVVEALERIRDPADVRGGWLLVVALGGLAVNLGSLVVLRSAAGDSLNMRGAVLHMSLDAAGSVGAALAGAAVLLWDVDEADPVVSLLVAALVLWSAWSLLRATTHVLLEGTPRGLDPDTVSDALLDDADVEAVHHLHVWSLASDVPAMSAHVVLNGERTLHDAQASAERLKGLLEHRFGITHVTLELECHPCDGPSPATP
jgi:cobalt-zinc-cadmium efflux system protein